MKTTSVLPILTRIRADVHLYGLDVYYRPIALLRAGETVLVLGTHGLNNIILSSWGLGFVFDSSLVDFAGPKF